MLQRVGPLVGEDLTISEIEYDKPIAAHKDMRAHFGSVFRSRLHAVARCRLEG